MRCTPHRPGAPRRRAARPRRSGACCRRSPTPPRCCRPRSRTPPPRSPPRAAAPPQARPPHRRRPQRMTARPPRRRRRRRMTARPPHRRRCRRMGPAQMPRCEPRGDRRSAEPGLCTTDREIVHPSASGPIRRDGPQAAHLFMGRRRHLAEQAFLDDSRSASPSGPNLAKIGPESVKGTPVYAESGRFRIRTNFGRFGAGLGGRCWSKFVEFGPNLVEIGPNFTEFGQSSVDAGPILVDAWSMLVQCGRIRAKIGRSLACTTPEQHAQT